MVDWELELMKQSEQRGIKRTCIGKLGIYLRRLFNYPSYMFGDFVVVVG